MLCNRCGKEIGEQAGTCDECNAPSLQLELEDASERVAATEERSSHKRPLNRTKKSPEIIYYATPQNKGVSFQIVFIALVIFLFIGWPYIKGKQELPEIQLASSFSQEDPCKYKEACLICYLTPWCPACRGAVPTVQLLQAHYKDSETVGFKVIVGSDSQESLEQYGDKIGGLIYYDPQNEFKRAARFSSVPTLIHTDRYNMVIKKKPGMPVGGSEREVIDYISSRMNLPG